MKDSKSTGGKLIFFITDKDGRFKVYTGQVNSFLLLTKSDRIEENSKSTGGKLIIS